VIEALSVDTFGMTGDGLDVPNSAADQAALDAIVGSSGSTAFLVDSLGYCGAPTSTAIGCAARPSCSGNPNDDPGLKLIVTMEAHEVYGVPPRVTARPSTTDAATAAARVRVTTAAEVPRTTGSRVRNAP